MQIAADRLRRLAAGILAAAGSSAEEAGKVAARLVGELYVAITLDRQKERPVVMASASGGMDIEEVAARDPDAILRLVQEVNRYQKIRINTVFTGTGTGADFLRRLAEENDGVFVQR